MKAILSLVAAILAAMIVAAPAHADPWIDDQVDDQFVRLLIERGFHVRTDLQATRTIGAYGRRICQAVDSGLPADDILAGVQHDNPTFTEMQATVFTAVAIRTYCPPTPTG